MTQKIYFVLLFLIFLGACSRKNEEKKPGIVATFENEVLYKMDIIKILPDNMSKKEEELFEKNYIEEWLLERILFKEAKKNIKDSSEIVDMIQNYRKQIYIYKYLEQKMNDELDFIVDSTEIKNYYYNNFDNYILKENYVKAHYITFSSKISTYFHVLDKMKNSNQNDVEELQKYCTGTDRNVYFINKWTPLQNFLLSVNYTDNILDINAGQIFDYVYDNYRYIVKIDEISHKNTIAPIEMVYNDIILIIINNRKKEKYAQIKKTLLEKFEQ